MKLAISGGKPIRARKYPQWPEVDRSDVRSVESVVKSGKWWLYAYSKDEFAMSGEGTSRVEAFEKAFAELQHVRFAYATSSGTASLEIACRAIGLKPGDEVITTPYTFVTTSTCILNAAAIPVYVDIDPLTYNMDARLVERAITSRTRAIIPVHFGGVFADMDALRAIASGHDLKIIEDAAHSHGASLTGNRWAGTLGDIAIFSLQESKLLTAGEGGLITTNDEELAELSWSLRHCGRSRAGKWYEHERVGWNSRMTELQGALLLSQLSKLQGQNARRRRNAQVLSRGLTGIPGITPNPQHPQTENDVYYLLCLRYDSAQWDDVPRGRVVKALNAEGIPVTEGYCFPLYENPLYRNVAFNAQGSPYLTGRPGPIPDFRAYRETCPVTERACRSEALWVAQNLLLGKEEDTQDIVRAFQKVFENRAELRTKGEG
jgi:dTDP-4-amino-4,6-dideoxygalactose transaminase